MEKQKKKKINWKIILNVLILLIIFGIGILLGIQIGTYAVIDHVTYGLAGSTFIINFNETNMVNQLVDKFIPIFNQSQHLKNK